MGEPVNFNRARGSSSLLVRFSVGLAGFIVFSAAMFAQTVDKKAILKQARQSYYSLKSEGLAEFGCTLEPNWDALLAGLKKTDPTAAAAAVRKLNQLHFQMTFVPGSDAKLTHNELSAENATMADGLKQVYSGMEQMTVGFFQTWTAFVLSPSFPEPESDYQLEDLGTTYRLTYKEGAATDVVTTMGKDLVISSLKVNTKEFQSTIWPQFTRTPKGFLLSGYQATYAGATPAETTELHIVIDYQLAGGFQVPKKMNLKGSYGGSPFDVEVAFTNCQAH
jgi:hypothetical protein